MRYRIRRRVVAAPTTNGTDDDVGASRAPSTIRLIDPNRSEDELVSVCVDRWTMTTVRCQNEEGAMIACLKENIDSLAQSVKLFIDTRRPVVFGGPGVYREQLLEQMWRNAFVVYDAFDACTSLHAATPYAVPHAPNASATLTDRSRGSREDVYSSTPSGNVEGLLFARRKDAVRRIQT